MQAPTLTTDRLIITGMTIDHWEDYAAAWADPRMTEFIGGQPRSRTESWMKFLQGIALWDVVGYGFFAFAERETGAFVGNGGLARFERGLPELEGYPEAGWAFVPDAWGKGYATEAIGAVLDWSDNVLRAPEVRCIISPGNTASQNVAAKLSFAKIGENDAVLGPTWIYARTAK